MIAMISLVIVLIYYIPPNLSRVLYKGDFPKIKVGTLFQQSVWHKSSVRQPPALLPDQEIKFGIKCRPFLFPSHYVIWNFVLS